MPCGINRGQLLGKSPNVVTAVNRCCFILSLWNQFVRPTNLKTETHTVQKVIFLRDAVAWGFPFVSKFKATIFFIIALSARTLIRSLHWRHSRGVDYGRGVLYFICSPFSVKHSISASNFFWDFSLICQQMSCKTSKYMYTINT